jgi:deazaflavin-dependent oxidoreductase (nitroreductase family)
VANWRWFTQLHDFAYRKTGGRIGGSLMGIPMLRLTAVGRRTGQSRTLPLACYRDGENWVIVASNDGQDHDPAWWLNLQAHPEARVQVGRQEHRVHALLADAGERTRLWPELVRVNPHYARYAQKTDREIPVVILRRLD